MSVTKFAFLPPNSAGAMSNNFPLDSLLNTSPIWCLPLQHSSPCKDISERRQQSHPNCQSQLLGYWLQFMTVFGKMHEEEIEILSTLFFITDTWLWALALYKPLDSSWVGGKGVHSPWGMTLLCFPVCWLVSPSNSVSLFFIWLHWAEKAKILASNNSSSWPLSVALPWKQGCTGLCEFWFSLGLSPDMGLSGHMVLDV